MIDPLGFALEHYDAIGRWRETDRGAPINATIDWRGQTIDSPRAFREALLGRGATFVDTVAEKLLTYALGRGLNYRDAPTVRQLVRDVAQGRVPVVVADRGHRREYALPDAATSCRCRGRLRGGCRRAASGG